MPRLGLALTRRHHHRAVTPGHLSGSNYNATVVALSTDLMEVGGVCNDINGVNYDFRETKVMFL